MSAVQQRLGTQLEVEYLWCVQHHWRLMIVLMRLSTV